MLYLIEAFSSLAEPVTDGPSRNSRLSDEAKIILDELVRAKIHEIVKERRLKVVDQLLLPQPGITTPAQNGLPLTPSPDPNGGQQLGHSPSHPGPSHQTPPKADDQVPSQHWQWLEEHVETILGKIIAMKIDHDLQKLSQQRGSRQAAVLEAFKRITPEALSTHFSLSLLMATLGAGFTFTVIFSDLPEPRPSFTTNYVRRCVAASWLLFVGGMALASSAQLMFIFLKMAKPTIWLSRLTIVIAGLIAMDLVGAFLASAEAVRAYQGGIGITMLVCVGLAGVFLAGVVGLSL